MKRFVEVFVDRLKVRSILRFLQSLPGYDRLIFKKIRKPYQDEFMELVHGSWSGVASARDTSRRQLGEDNVTPLLLRCPVPTNWARWKAKDIRRGCLFNVTALQQVTQNWRTVQELSLTMRAKLLQSRKEPDQSRLNIAGLFSLSVILTSIPAWLLRRCRNALQDGQIPTSIAATYKTAAGVQYGVRHALATGQTFTHAGQLIDYSECHLLLATSSSGRVCSGPRRLLEDYTELLLCGNRVKGGPSVLKESELVEAFTYGVEAAKLEVLTCLHCLDVARTALEQSALGADHRGASEVLGDYDPVQGPWAALEDRKTVLEEELKRLWPGWESIFPAPRNASFGELLDHFRTREHYWFEHFRAIHKTLMASLGRTYSDPPYEAISHRVADKYRVHLAKNHGMKLMENRGRLEWFR